ncbi:MAG: porphobilinogen synthase [Verrucomicrobiae bacterium]|nr:porphobilinogen synthase [Verrucomicrobiae bacterium]
MRPKFKIQNSKGRQAVSVPPHARFRRLRYSPALREMTAETRLHPSQLILPLFVCAGRGVRRAVPSMPGVFRLSPDQIVRDLKEAEKLGLRAFILFGVVDARQKNPSGSEALRRNNVVCETLRMVKKAGIRMAAITDLCFCEYTSHGHCGPITRLRKTDVQTVDNNATLALLGRQAVIHAEAGADVIAPSGMMDGMVAAIRFALDRADFQHLPILSYAVKYASAFYGPFRDAAGSAPGFGDRRSYQMDGRRRREARLEALADLEQGADMIMVKPGLPYLDILRDLRETANAPLASYQVSGEYAMIKAAAKNGWIDEECVMMETLTSIKRAGADLILTYFAREAARLLN